MKSDHFYSSPSTSEVTLRDMGNFNKCQPTNKLQDTANDVHNYCNWQSALIVHTPHTINIDYDNAIAELQIPAIMKAKSVCRMASRVFILNKQWIKDASYGNDF